MSPSFVLAFAFDGRAYVAREAEPYDQYWLTETYRILLGQFGSRRGTHIADAVAGYFRQINQTPDAKTHRRLHQAIEDMRTTGVLIGTRDEVSRYSSKIVEDYRRHRPFPPQLADLLIQQAGIGADSRVLDLAGGPGDLALALAHRSNAVSLMELSKGFLRAAALRAKVLGVPLTTVHDSCNRLLYRDESYEVITVSQALHWLDDVAVCRGVGRLLTDDGSFFVIHSAIELAEDHPLAFVLGNDSFLGKKVRQAFSAEVRPLFKRLSLLFEALDAPDVQRIDPAQQWGASDATVAGRIVPVGMHLFRQQRPFGAGYARGFLTPQHLAPSGLEPTAFWQDVHARCAAATATQLTGVQHWAVLHFQRRLAPDRLVMDDNPLCSELTFDAAYQA